VLLVNIITGALLFVGIVLVAWYKLKLDGIKSDLLEKEANVDIALDKATEVLANPKTKYTTLKAFDEMSPGYMEQMYSIVENDCFMFMLEKCKMRIVEEMANPTTPQNETASHALRNNLLGVQMVKDDALALHQGYITLNGGNKDGEA